MGNSEIKRGKAKKFEYIKKYPEGSIIENLNNKQAKENSTNSRKKM